jgi:hypothetical protein
MSISAYMWQQTKRWHLKSLTKQHGITSHSRINGICWPQLRILCIRCYYISDVYYGNLTSLRAQNNQPLQKAQKEIWCGSNQQISESSQPTWDQNSIIYWNQSGYEGTLCAIEAKEAKRTITLFIQIRSKDQVPPFKEQSIRIKQSRSLSRWFPLKVPKERLKVLLILI